MPSPDEQKLPEGTFPEAFSDIPFVDREAKQAELRARLTQLGGELEQNLAKRKAALSGLAVGRIVHYVLESGRSQGEHRPAIVVRHWNNPTAPDMVQLQVFTDGSNDGFMDVHTFHLKNDERHELHLSANTLWRTSVHYSEEPLPGTWHWPERV